MASVNKAILLGRLGKDPENLIPADGGTQICHLAVATSRKFKDRSGERKEETDWHNVVIFGRQAEVAQQYLKKGSEVYIEGRLRTHKYVGKKAATYKTQTSRRLDSSRLKANEPELYQDYLAEKKTRVLRLAA